ncbi:MAG: PspC domain-containing protein [Spirosomaceae bacterium]|nr:PspC domain-containing protein [Spirosomataceae bacterium]
MKKLRRIKSESMLGGVAAGLAEYFDIDVTLIRIVLAIGIFAPFPVVIPYVVMWIVMPVAEPALPGSAEPNNLMIVSS